MAIGFPFNSHVEYDENETPIFDRAVDSGPLKNLIAKLFSNGVLPNPATNLQVVTGEVGMSVIVKAGFCIINGGLKLEEEDKTLVVQAADTTYPRIDTVVMRWNDNDEVRACDLYVLEGTPAAIPVRPELTRTESVYELGLADIYITKGSTSIDSFRITDTRLDNSRCGIISSISEFDTSEIYAQIQSDMTGFKAEEQQDFLDWFEEMRDQLSEDAAGNLQNQIDQTNGRFNALTEDVQRWEVRNVLPQSGVEGTVYFITGEQETHFNGDVDDDEDAIINDDMVSKATTYSSDKIQYLLQGKVNAESNKGLSSNDYTNADKEKVNNAITQLKTINGQSIVGTGNIDIQGGSGESGTDYFNLNVMLIDHQYPVDGIYNTLAAYKASYARGYKWLEIDVNPTSDGEWIISHDTTGKVYKNGVRETVTWANKTAYEISQYTWDAAGQYPVATLDEVFSAFRNTDCRFILDRKGSITSNESLVQVASRHGMLDSILLSYYSTSQLSNDATLLAKYPYIPLRVFINSNYNSASTYSTMVTLMSQIKNPMYADINTSNSNYYKAHIATALALGLPIIFSACLENNKAIWQILARGVMTDSKQDHWYPSITELAECFAPDDTHLADIVCDTQSLNIENGTTTGSIIASTSARTKNGFLYAYSKNPSIAYVQQNAWGLSITFTVHGASNGSTTIEVFNALGNKVSIPVTVASAVVKTLDSITASVSNPTVVKDETYTPNATVIAHYTDASTANVTESATHDSIDTSTLGAKTMTFTYSEGGVTKTAEVTITVVEEQPTPTGESFDIHPRIALNVNSQYPHGRFQSVNTRGVVAPEGVEVNTNTNLQANQLFEIPPTATGLTFTCPNYYGALGLWNEVQGALSREFDTGWSESKGAQSATFTAGQYGYASCTFSNGTSTVESAIDPTGWSVVFTYD